MGRRLVVLSPRSHAHSRAHYESATSLPRHHGKIDKPRPDRRRGRVHRHQPGVERVFAVPVVVLPRVVAALAGRQVTS